MNRRVKGRIWVTSGVLGATAAAGVAALFLATQLGAASYATGRYEQAASIGETLVDVPGADAVHGRFLQGTSLAAAGDLEGATAALEDALHLVRPGGDDCGLRFNLALVLEARGDADADPVSAGALFDRAAVIASGAQEDCRLRPFGGGSGAGETAGAQLQELAERAHGKTAAAEARAAQEPEGEGESADEPAPGEAPTAEETTSPQDEELERRMAEGFRSHSGALNEHNDDVHGPEPEAPVDRPW